MFTTNHRFSPEKQEVIHALPDGQIARFPNRSLTGEKTKYQRLNRKVLALYRNVIYTKIKSKRGIHIILSIGVSTLNITINVDANLLSIIGAVVAIIAMLVSCWQAHIAKTSLKIEQSVFNDRKPKFTFDGIIDAYADNDKCDTSVHLRFLLLITNRSDRTMALRRIQLKIRGDNGDLYLDPITREGCITIGENIEGNHSLSKWVQFDIPRKQYTHLDILDYEIELEDTFKNSQKHTAIYVREEVHNIEK